MSNNIVDLDSFRRNLADDIASLQTDTNAASERGQVDKSGGGTQPPDMTDARLDRLEKEVATLHQDMRGVHTALAQIQATLATLPTKVELSLLPTRRDLTTNVFASLGIGLAIMGLTIGGIIGGLSWIKPDAAPPTPVTITAPPPVIVQVPTAPPAQQLPTPSSAAPAKKP